MSCPHNARWTRSLSFRANRFELDLTDARPSHTMSRLDMDESGTIRAIPPLSAAALSLGGTAPFQPPTSMSRRVRVGSDNACSSPFAPHGNYISTERSFTFIEAAAARIADLPMGTDIRVVDHLVHIYFLWQHSIFPILSRKAFTDSFRSGGSYYSPLLLCVSLSIVSISNK